MKIKDDKMFDVPDFSDISCLGHVLTSLPERIIMHLLRTVFKLLLLNFLGFLI